jgi:hypothetical protein
MLTPRQNFYFDVTVKHPKIKETISSPREFEFENLLIEIGYKKGKDFTHQFACACDEMNKVYVADFAFPDEKIIIELDGENHKYKQHRNEDILRDKVFNNNGYTVLRIKTPLDEEQKRYWRYLIKEIISYIREQKYGKEPEMD